MFANRQVFDEDVVPEHELVVHRQVALERLEQSLRPSGDGVVSTDLTYVLGPTGTGKTMSTQVVLDRLLDLDGDQLAFVNCWEHYERFDILYHVAQALTDGVQPRSACSTGQLCSRLQDVDGRPAYVVLDEADQLHDKKVFYDLFDAPVHLVLVGNSETELLAGIDDRVRSRLTAGRRITMEAYSTAELSSILGKRAEYALHGTPVDENQLEFIAMHADGDARVAIQTLRVAVENAIADDHRTVTDDDVEAAVPDARAQLRRKSIDQLNDHQRAIYDVVAERGPVRMRELYDAYEQRVRTPRSKRMVRSHLTKLAHYSLVESEGETKGRRYVTAESATHR